MNAEAAFQIFEQTIVDYHRTDDVDASMKNPHSAGSMEALLYRKNWIDTVQWHLEDIVREPTIDPAEGLALKRRIDKSNQERTDVVEQVDDMYIEMLKDAKPASDARLNTESPGWAMDRLSILALKIYHMREQVQRQDAQPEHIQKCQAKLDVLMEQKSDLIRAFDELIEDIRAGRRFAKVYRQMKMYNDASLNPVLYAKSKG
ncbi:MAG: DUF4254 domain-containing protein [Leptospiraceae bacterium]|nr:DUF4254 domain-containing protein [Leptospiraceae bacterium]